MAIAGPKRTSEAEDLRQILGYLGLAQSSAEAVQITGLTKSAISEVLGGRRKRDTSRRRHIAIVAALIDRLAEGRHAAAGVTGANRSAIGWLHTARVATTRGQVTPLQLMADTELVMEALDELTR